MPNIKTRDVVKGTVKTIDKSAVAAERMKDAYIRTKDKAEHGIYSADNSPNEYAADHITGSAESAAVKPSINLTSKAAVGFVQPKRTSPKRKNTSDRKRRTFRKSRR